MTYFDIVNQAIELCITTDSTTGISYLEPPYRMLLRDAGLINEELISTEELYELLKLEVQKMNAQVDQTKVVADWVANILTSTVDPAVMTEENELIKNFMEYMKTKNLNTDEEKEPVEEPES